LIRRKYSVTAKIMARYALSFLLTIIAGGFLTATMVRLSPGFEGDEELLDTRLNETSRDAIRRQHDAERDIPGFYLRHIGNLVRGDFGFSRSMQQPVGELLAVRLPVTAKLMALGMAGGWLMGLALATAVVLWRAPLWSGLAAGLTGVLLSVPSAVLAFLIFYYGGPVQFVMALALFPKVFQYARNVLCQVRGMPHVLGAHAKGLSAGRVFVRHILQVSLPSLVALAGVSVSMAFSAAIPVEVICDQPGIGQLAWKAALARDLPLLVTITFLVVVLTQAGNLLSDCATVLCGGRNA